MKHHSLSKVLKRLACVLAALVIALAVAVFALWHNELATLSSLKKLSDRDEAHRDGAVYQLNVSGGYYFDDFLAQGGDDGYAYGNLSSSPSSPRASPRASSP